MDNRIRFTNGSSISLLKAERAILDSEELALHEMLTFDGRRCGVGVLENWTRSTYGAQTFSRRITPNTRRILLNVNDLYPGDTTEHNRQRARHVAAFLRGEAK
jgi:hypothetical protein